MRVTTAIKMVKAAATLTAHLLRPWVRDSRELQSHLVDLLSAGSSVGANASRQPRRIKNRVPDVHEPGSKNCKVALSDGMTLGVVILGTASKRNLDELPRLSIV